MNPMVVAPEIFDDERPIIDIRTLATASAVDMTDDGRGGEDGDDGNDENDDEGDSEVKEEERVGSEGLVGL